MEVIQNPQNVNMDNYVNLSKEGKFMEIAFCTTDTAYKKQRNSA